MSRCDCGLCVPLVPGAGVAVVTLERSETIVVRGLAARNPERRAEHEEALFAALAEGDREAVSRLTTERTEGAEISCR